MAERVRFVERNGTWGFFALLSFIGAAIYFVGESDGSFGAVVLGLLKAIVWPVFAVYHGLDSLGA